MLAGGFYLIPSFGLPLTLSISGSLNFLIAIVFMANPLKGKVQKKEELEKYNKPLISMVSLWLCVSHRKSYYRFEIIFIRILNLTLGANPYNFTLILFVVILGLGTGSLFVNTKKLSASVFLKKILTALCFLMVIYMTIPYWPSWLSSIRVSLTSIPSNYPVFLFLNLIFCLFILGFPMFL